MKRVFADTSYFLALVNRKSPHHAAAVRLSRRVRRIVVTGFVAMELGNALSQVPDRPVFLKLLAGLREDLQTTWIPCSDEWIERGRALYARRLDKEWSLTDCISFEAMRQLKIDEALTTDHHFEQAGFVALLR